MTITAVLDPRGPVPGGAGPHSFGAPGPDLVLTRTLAVPAERIWDHVATSGLLATWYGTVTGDPSAGHVNVTMTAEPGEVEASEYTIHACEPGRLLTVSSGVGSEIWKLTLLLEAVGEAGGAADAAADSGSTHLSLRHHHVPLAMLADIGPGWEWYLDRLTGAVTGGEIPGMDVWQSRYLPLGGQYAALMPPPS